VSATAAGELIGELGAGVRGHVPFPGNPPLFIEPVAEQLGSDLDAAVDWFAARSEVVDQLLVRHGAVVLRGFPVPDATSFDRFVRHYPPHAQGYTGGATPRKSIEGNVYEATQIPATVPIPLHQEMAYLKHYPEKLAFHCTTPAATGGETIIGDMRRFMAGLPARFVRNLEQNGLTYRRNFRAPDRPHGCDAHPHIYHATLTQGFGTDDRAQVERACQRIEMAFEWLPDGSLSTRLDRDALAPHPRTGERVYFNHILTQIIDPDWMGDTYEPYLDLYDRAGNPRPYHVTYGDGSPIADSDYRLVADGLTAVVMSFLWQAGDVMVVDNIFTAHGRNPYTGTRSVEVALIG